MIEPRYNNLQTLFGNRVFRIPAYQRFYSWEAKQRRDLFGDIDKLSRTSTEQHHFMATVVCARTQDKVNVGTNEYVVHDIVDGQQRLTTLIILLKCLEEALPEGMLKEELAGTLVKKDGSSLLLQTNNAMRISSTPSCGTALYSIRMKSSLNPIGICFTRFKKAGDMSALGKTVAPWRI